jgi:hypothetical protein
MIDPVTASAAISAIGGATGAGKSVQSGGRAESGSSMYGNFSTGEFNLGGGGTSNMIMVAVGVVAIALIIFLAKK